jgi:hypothetical protein
MAELTDDEKAELHDLPNDIEEILSDPEICKDNNEKCLELINKLMDEYFEINGSDDGLKKLCSLRHLKNKIDEFTKKYKPTTGGGVKYKQAVRKKLTKTKKANTKANTKTTKKPTKAKTKTTKKPTKAKKA